MDDRQDPAFPFMDMGIEGHRKPGKNEDLHGLCIFRRDTDRGYLVVEGCRENPDGGQAGEADRGITDEMAG